MSPSDGGSLGAVWQALTDASPPPAVSLDVDEVAAEHVALLERALRAEHERDAAVHALKRVRARRAVRVPTAALAAARAPSLEAARKLRSSLEPAAALEPPDPPDLDAATREVERRYRGVQRGRLHPPAVPQPHVRIGHLGEVARFRDLAHHVDLDGSFDLDAAAAPGLDLVLLEPGPDGALSGDVTRIASWANAAQIPVVAIVPGELPPSLPSHVEVLREGLDADLAPGVVLGRFNPQRWRHSPPDPIVSLATVALLEPGERRWHPSIPPRHRDLRALLADRRHRHLADQLRRTGVLVDAPGFHPDAAIATRLRLAALASGIPVVVIGEADPLTAPYVQVVEREQDVGDVVHRLLIDPDHRERVSIEGRRWVGTAHATDVRLRQLLTHVDVEPAPPPTVSVVLSTNRPERVAEAVASVASQSYANRELILVLHGDGHPEDVETPPDLPTTVLRASSSLVLGECLNLAIRASRGDLVAKMDDDDHYGEHHLTDLVLARRYSGADVVGKRVEFVHLAESGRTIRRTRTVPETYREHVGGPTLLLTAEVARRIGFLNLPNRVDTTLCDRVIDHGGRIYRTHSRDIVLERRRAGHTWDVSDRTLQAEAVEERPGAAVAWASSRPDLEL